MTDHEDEPTASGRSRAGERTGTAVQPLERTAPVYVDSTDGYVDIRQPSGDPTLYTPEEARDIARDILAAAEESERATGSGGGRRPGAEDDRQ
jgi:hypothetical protein